MKYVWYKLESHFGPGHQSTEIRYFYSPGVLDRASRKDIEIEECHEIASRYDTQCVTRLRIVKKVPPEEIARLRSNAERKIRNAEGMIEALKQLDKSGNVG